jgi:hypothetical protein
MKPYEYTKVPRSIHSNNEKTYAAIRNLLTHEGEPAVVGVALMIIDRIASFKQSCYLSAAQMIQECGLGVGEKTFRRIERYLEEEGLDVVGVDLKYCEKGTIKYRYLKMPKNRVVISQKEFNRKLREPKTSPVSSEGGSKCDFRGVQVAPTGGSKIAPQVVDSSLLRESMNNHLKSSFVTSGALGRSPTASAIEVGQTAGRPVCEAPPRDRVMESYGEKIIVSKDQVEVDELGLPKSEPMKTQRKFKKTPKNTTERRIESLAKIAQGHCANPTGTPDNSGHLIRRNKILTPLPSSGSVSRNLLYNHLLDRAEDSLGEPSSCTESRDKNSVVYQTIPCDRSGFDSWMAELRQVFIDVGQVDPSGRELADYISWFFSPENLQHRMKDWKKSGSMVTSAIYALRGKAIVLMYCDKVLRSKKKTVESEDNKLSTARQMSDFVAKAFDGFRRHKDDDYATISDLVQYGMVLYAQYLADETGRTESECKQRIIQVLVRYLRHPEAVNPEARLQKIMTATEVQSPMYDEDVTMFKEWRELCPSIIALAKEQAGEKL